MKIGKITSQVHKTHTHSDTPLFKKQTIIVFRDPKIKFSYKENKETK